MRFDCLIESDNNSFINFEPILRRGKIKKERPRGMGKEEGRLKGLDFGYYHLCVTVILIHKIFAFSPRCSFPSLPSFLVDARNTLYFKNKNVFPRVINLKKGRRKDSKFSSTQFYIYDSTSSTRKPFEIKATHKRISLNDIKKLFNANTVRLFNSDGAEYF